MMETLAGLLLTAIVVLIAGWLLLPVIVNFGVALSDKSKPRPPTPEQYQLGRDFARNIWQTQADPHLAKIMLESYAEIEQLKVGKDLYSAYSQGILHEIAILCEVSSNGN